MPNDAKAPTTLARFQWFPKVGRRTDSEERMSTKADYVRAQGQTRNHHCHWPDCDKQVPPAAWGCKAHWFALPIGLRNRIWATFKPGQEVNGTPSAAYIEAAKAVQQWIKDRQ
jgi:hypothetical protein